MKLNVKGLVFVGFAAAVFASAAQAETGDDKKVTSLAYTEATYVKKNNNITAGTHPKITYDAKGLVTAGADLVASDIPDISATYQATTQKLTQGTATTDQITGANIADDKYPTAAVVRKSIDLAVGGASGNYQPKETVANKISGANGTWKALNSDIGDTAAEANGFDSANAASSSAIRTYVESKLVDSVANESTTQAPTQNAVHDALALKQDVAIGAAADAGRLLRVASDGKIEMAGDTVDIGSATKGVYIVDGVPTAMTYELNKTVPSDAVFTDHTYSGDTSTITVDANGQISAVTTGGVAANGTNLVTGGQVATELANYQATSQKLTQGTATTDQITGASITDDKYPTAAVVRKSIDLAISGSNNGVVLPTINTSTCNATTPCALVLAGDQPTWEPIQQ